MTVDDRLRAAHERIPAPDEATVARARARLTTAMGTRPRRRPLRLALPAVALALAAAAAVALVPSEVPVERPARPRAAAPLDPAAVLAGGKVVYQRGTFHLLTRYIGANGRPMANPDDAAYAISRSVPEEIWLAPDGSGRILYGHESGVYLPSPGDARAWRAAGSPDLEKLMGPVGRWGPKKSDYGPGELDTTLIFNSNLEAVLPKDDPLSVVPHEPGALRAFLEDAAVKQRPKGPETLVRDTFVDDALTFLRYPRTPADLRAALLEVLAAHPGTRKLGDIKDSAGRTVAALQLSEGGGRVVAFDAATSRLMATGSKVPGGVRWNMTYALTTAGVPAIGDRP
jgi:hypothetical protein